MDHFQPRRSVPKMTANWQLINHLFPLVLGTSAEISYCITSDNPDLGSASDWSCREGNLLHLIRSTTQIWVVTRHQYGISAIDPEKSFRGKVSDCVTKCRLFSQAISNADSAHSQFQTKEGKTIWSCTHLYNSYKAVPTTLSSSAGDSTPKMYPTKFYTRRLGPEVQPLTLLYRKGNLSYTFCGHIVPLCIPFKCCKCTHPKS